MGVTVERDIDLVAIRTAGEGRTMVLLTHRDEERAKKAKESLGDALRSFRFEVKRPAPWVGCSFTADGVPMWFLDTAIVGTYWHNQEIPVDEWSRALGEMYGGKRSWGHHLWSWESQGRYELRGPGSTTPIASFPDVGAFREFWEGFVASKPVVGVAGGMLGYQVEARAGSSVVPLGRYGADLVPAIWTAKAFHAALAEPSSVWRGALRGSRGPGGEMRRFLVLTLLCGCVHRREPYVVANFDPYVANQFARAATEAVQFYEGDAPALEQVEAQYIGTLTIDSEGSTEGEVDARARIEAAGYGGTHVIRAASSREERTRIDERRTFFRRLGASFSRDEFNCRSTHHGTYSTTDCVQTSKAVDPDSIPPAYQRVVTEHRTYVVFLVEPFRWDQLPPNLRPNPTRRGVTP